MKIATEQFKNLVNKVSKGVGNNKLLPLTSMIGVKYEKPEAPSKVNSSDDFMELLLMSTDGSNTLIVKHEEVADDLECFDITVPAAIFTQLVSKITSEFVELKVVDNVLQINGNGVYKIPVVMDEDGVVVFTSPVISHPDFNYCITRTNLVNVVNINQASLATTFENPCLTSYWIGDCVLSSDSCVLCLNDTPLIAEDHEAFLVSPETMNLATLIESEKINLSIEGNQLSFAGVGTVLYSKKQEGIEVYPHQALKDYKNREFISSCVVSKSALINALGRLKLFIETYDRNGAYLSFTRQGINIRSRQSSSSEVVSYLKNENFEPFTTLVDIPMLESQLVAYPENDITIHFGNKRALKLTNRKITQVICLMEEAE